MSAEANAALYVINPSEVSNVTRYELALVDSFALPFVHSGSKIHDRITAIRVPFHSNCCSNEIGR